VVLGCTVQVWASAAEAARRRPQLRRRCSGAEAPRRLKPALPLVRMLQMSTGSSFWGVIPENNFNPKASDAVNYGGIGAVIGHELTHGFDDQGRSAFESRADCIAKEYSGFSPVPDVHLNGKTDSG